MTSSDKNPVWMISGCSSGLGRALGKAVIDRGWNAVLTARDPASLDDLVAEAGDRAIAVQLDVTDGAQISAAVAKAKAHFGRIDALVNNAGYGYISVIELAKDAEIRAQFETNFFGLVRMTQAVLPVMREQRKGHIINIGSIAGVGSGASAGFYAASKHAVEAITEALADECVAFNIKATVVEPGTFTTDFVARSLKRTSTDIPEYVEAVRAFSAHPDELIKDRRPGDPARGAAAILDCFLLNEPPLRLPLGMDAYPRMKEALDRRISELSAWRHVADATAFPNVR